MKTNVWLRECVYKRVAVKGKKPGNRVTAITFFTSALWHGIAAGYYLTFFTGALITSSARLARQSLRPLFVSPSPYASYKSIYDFLATLTSIAILNYTAAPFILSTWSDSIKLYKVLGWYGHIVVVGSLVMFYAGGVRWAKGMQRRLGVLQEKGSVKKENGKENGSASGAGTPVEEKNMVVPPLDKLVPPPS
ncbi:hypothetical protein NP233_g4362 [Leucocoprinus birnbaumii]|uniref:Lysophospholipid acyltransferase n=1 Tax=Leucocoprinus birnbaumii TaxID=56174 RepID=A0AAD5VUT9_9AGAR|nr:hypothetical protein NP233_g4362 [Leucocoprinus birnbaumii]